MSATSGLMGGSQLFRQDESSRYYPRGLLIIIGLALMSLVLTALQELIYLLKIEMPREDLLGGGWVLHKDSMLVERPC